MIAKLTGTLSVVADERVIVDCAGIGYEVLIPSFALSELSGGLGREVTLHTIEFIEGNVAAGGALVPRLVGFLRPDDRVFFGLFTRAKGMGMRKSLRAFAEPAERIAAAIESADAATLARLPGVGKRLAAQLIADLRGKLEDFALAGEAAARTPAAKYTAAQRDALEVLLAWGERRADAEAWLARAAQLHPDLAQPDEWIRAAYRIKGGADG